MGRSEAVRQAALERDGYRCAVSGWDGRDLKDRSGLAIHHWKRLGVGGSDELDTVENAITLSAKLHSSQIHPGVSIPTLRITHWDPGDLKNGLTVECRRTAAELAEAPWEDVWYEVPRSELWFYQRQRVEPLEKAEARLLGLQAIEEDRARDLWELATGDPPGYTLLDGYSEGQTFSDYVSARNVSARLANEAVQAYGWIHVNQFRWPQGLQLEKVNLIKRTLEAADTELVDGRLMLLVNGESGGDYYEEVQSWLDGAVDPNYDTVRQNLIDAGLKVAQAGWYFIFPKELLEQAMIVPTYTRDLMKLLNEQTGGDNVVIRVWGFKRGLHRDPATGGLTLFGEPLAFVDETKKPFRMDMPEEAKKLAEAIREDLDSGRSVESPDIRRVTSVMRMKENEEET